MAVIRAVGEYERARCYRLDDYVVCESCFEAYLTPEQQAELEMAEMERQEADHRAAVGPVSVE